MKELINKSQIEYFDEYIDDKLSEIRQRVKNLSLEFPTFPAIMAVLANIFKTFEAQIYAMESEFKLSKGKTKREK